MKPYFLLAILFIACNQSPEEQCFHEIQGAFMGMSSTKNPQILEPGFISNSPTEYNGTFNSDGTEFFFTSELSGYGVIMHSKMNSDSSWSEPRVATFSGKDSEYDPIFSPDGSRLYFTSERATGDSASMNRSNIWYTEKEMDAWSEPQHLELSNNGDYYSSWTRTGKLYFNTWYNGDIYSATFEGGQAIIDTLPDAINGPSDAGDPFISPDEDYLIFRGYGGDSFGQGDLYISFLVNGEWTPRKNLGEPINSAAHEMCPLVTPDGEHFIFASGRMQEEFDPAGKFYKDISDKFNSFDNGQLNIYHVSADFIEEFRPN